MFDADREAAVLCEKEAYARKVRNTDAVFRHEGKATGQQTHVACFFTSRQFSFLYRTSLLGVVFLLTCRQSRKALSPPQNPDAGERTQAFWNENARNGHRDLCRISVAPGTLYHI